MQFIEAHYIDAAQTQISATREDGEVVVMMAIPGLSAYDDLIASKLPIAPGETAFVSAIQNLIDQAAKDRQYADGVSLASYKDSTNPQWAAEASNFIAWRDQVWVYAYGEFAKVQSGQRAQPSVAQIISELPKIVWPS